MIIMLLTTAGQESPLIIGLATVCTGNLNFCTLNSQKVSEGAIEFCHYLNDLYDIYSEFLSVNRAFFEVRMIFAAQQSGSL